MNDNEIKWIEASLGGSIFVEEVIPKKKTARCPEQLIISKTGDKRKRYLVVRGESVIQKFFIDRAIQMQLAHGKEFDGFCINYPVAHTKLQEISLVIYPYIENVEFVQEGYPVKFMRCLYKNALKQKNNSELIDMIKENYLDSWPEFMREKIKKMPYFLLWEKELKKRKNIKLGFEHGDYTPNNILANDENKIFLMDFEFAAEKQPIGYDLDNWYAAKGKKIFYVPYKKMNKIKRKLNNYINSILDREYGMYK